MELRHIYNIANCVNNSIDETHIKDNILNDIVITVSVSPTTHYAIDKEFYRITHNNSIEGFNRSENLITANINGVLFKIINKGEI